MSILNLLSLDKGKREFIMPANSEKGLQPLSRGAPVKANILYLSDFQDRIMGKKSSSNLSTDHLLQKVLRLRLRTCPFNDQSHKWGGFC